MNLYFGARNQAFKGINSGLKPKLLWILNAINFLSSLYIPGEDWDLQIFVKNIFWTIELSSA